MSQVDDMAARPAVRNAADMAVRPAGAPVSLSPASRTWMRRGLAASTSRALADRRLFILLPFALILGIVMARLPPRDPDPVLLVAVHLGLLVAVWASRYRLAAARGLLLANAFWFGFSLLSLHGALFGTPMLAGSAYGTYSVRVDEVISQTEDGSTRLFVSRVTPVSERTRPVEFRRARLFVREPVEISTGDRLTAAIRFTAVPGPTLPGAFDPQFQAYFDGIGAYGTVTSGLTIETLEADGGAGRVIEWVRRTIGERIDGVLPQPAAGIARALITGDQSLIADDARAILGTSGLAHVYSISGLHLTMVAGLVYWLLRMALSLAPMPARMPSARSIAAMAGMVAALLYFSISGGNVAAQRATLMILLVFGAILAGRRALTMRNVAIAGLLVVLIDPVTIFRPSFQLSFAAVIALIAAVELGGGRGARRRGLVRQGISYFGALMLTSLVAGAATLLFSAYHFQQTSPLGVLGNLLVLPVVSGVMMPAGLFAALAMPFGLDGPFLLAMGWSIDWMMWVAQLVTGWSQDIDASPLLSPWALLIGLLALGWLAFFRDRWRLVGPALALPAILLFAMDREPDLLVADTTQAVAVQSPYGLALLAGRGGSFVTQVWAETYSREIVPLPKDMRRCDAHACLAETPSGMTVALVFSADAFSDECGRVDVVVTRLVAPASCRRNSLTIDASDLARRGAQRVTRLPDGRIDLVPAIDDPDRRWRPARR